MQERRTDDVIQKTVWTTKKERLPLDMQEIISLYSLNSSYNNQNFHQAFFFFGIGCPMRSNRHCS